MSKYRGFDILPGSYTGWDAVSEGYDASFEDGMWRSNGHLFNAATEAEVKRLVDEHLEEQGYERVECEVCGRSGRVTPRSFTSFRKIGHTNLLNFAETLIGGHHLHNLNALHL